MKNVLWPIERDELGRFAPALFIFFFISVCYNLLRPLKISLVVAAPHSGAEIIPYLKVWGVLPGAVFFTFIFTVLSRHLSRENVFYAMMAIFMSFFVVFLFLLYPNRESVEMTFLSDWLARYLPQGMAGLVAMIRYWHYTLFYLFSELWQNIISSMLFWGFVNETTTVAQAARFYAIFAVGQNFASVAAGQLGVVLSRMPYYPSLGFGQNAWDQTVSLVVIVVLAAALVINGLFWYLNKKVKMTGEVSVADKSVKEPKIKISLVDCFREMLRSPYLMYLAFIVLGYNLVFNLTDVMWSYELRQMFQNDSGALNIYMSQVTIAKGILASVIAVFVAGPVIRMKGWRFAALITPVALIVTSALFFPLMLLEGSNANRFEFLLGGISMLQAIVFIGAVQNCVTRACKYTIFDATKELAYIPLDLMDQRRGKAVIDGIGSRFGKSAGSVIYQILMIFCSSLAATLPYVTVLVLLMTAVWTYSIVGLSREMNRGVRKKRAL